MLQKLNLMKNLSVVTLILSLQSFKIINCDGYISMFAPKVMQAKLPYEIFYRSLLTDNSHETEISVQIRNANVTQKLQYIDAMRIQYPNLFDISKDSTSFYATVLRNSTGLKPMCSTQQAEIKVAKRQFLTFIQLDKPIYKPGDEVRAKIIVLDRNLSPREVTSIAVEVYTQNNLMAYSTEILDSKLGVGEFQFDIAEQAMIGEWKIRAVIDRYGQYSTTKHFPVQKYALYSFEVIVIVSDSIIHRNSSLKISFYALNKFNEMLNGKAEVTYEISDKRITKRFPNVTGVQTFEINVNNELGIILPKKFSFANCKVTISFEEMKSKETVNKTLSFAIDGDRKYKLLVLHDKTFTPGMPYTVSVKIFDYLKRPVIEHVDTPEFNYTIRTTTGKNVTGNMTEDVESEIRYMFAPQEDWTSLEFQVRFLNSKIYKGKIKLDKIGNEENKLKAFILPEKPSLGETFTVFVQNWFQELDQIIVFVMNGQGTLESKQVNCNTTYPKLCTFSMVMREKFLPFSTLSIYHIHPQRKISYGLVDIRSESIGSNMLSLTMDAEVAKPKQQVDLTLVGEIGSRVHVLAFDKRILNLPIKAETLLDNIQDSYSNYDRNHEIFMFDESSIWHECTETELKRIESGRSRLHFPSKKTLVPSSKHETEYHELEHEEEEDEESEPSDAVENFLRDSFEDSWIFDTLSIDGSSTVSKAYTVPDSITTWAVSAFAAVEDQRLAIAPLKELRVENEFYIQVNLPYSIRYKEVLRLDVIVFNFVASREELNVEVQLDNEKGEFEFIGYESEDDFCLPIPHNYTLSIEEVVIPHMSVQYVKFYIRPKDFNASNPSGKLKKILIDITAIGTGTKRQTIYIDKVQRMLPVEPVGVTQFDINTTFFNVSGKEEKQTAVHSWECSHDTEYQCFPSSAVSISTNYITKASEISDKFNPYWWNSLEHRASRLKESVEYYRYELSQGRYPDRSNIFHYYQSVMNEQSNSIWPYYQSSGFLAFRLDSLITMAELKILWNIHHFEYILKKELFHLQSQQAENGHFGPSRFPDGPSETNSKTLFDTAQALIPFLKYQIYKKDKNLFMIPVSKGMNFIDMTVMSGKTLSNEAYSKAAYAYALHGDRKSSTDLIKQLETFSHLKDDKKCYKLSINGTDCDLRTTVFAGLAQITLGKLEEAASIVRWLLPKYNSAHNTLVIFEYALAAEVISRMASYLKVDNFDLNIRIYNDVGTENHVSIDETNKNETRLLQLPDFERNVSFEVSGTGYCSISTIYEEKHFAFDLKSEKFVVYAETRETDKEIIIKACVDYQKSIVIRNIINEIELPSGYMLESYHDLTGQLKSLQVANRGSLLILIYAEFPLNKTYCTDIKVRKVFDVKNLQMSSLKAYNTYYYALAVSYYNIAKNCMYEMDRNILQE